MPGPGPLLLRSRPSPSHQQQLMSLPPRGVHHLLLLGAVVIFLSLLSTPVQAFLPTATPTPPSSSSSSSQRLPSSTTTTLHSSTGSGWRGGPRPDDEPVDLSGNGGVMKRVIRPGFGYKQESPPPHAYCKIAFVMKTATGQVIADRMKEPMEFMLGLERPEVIPGWELAVATMKPNEIAEITCAPDYAFGAAEGYEDKIPPGATIITRLQLIDWRSLKGAGSTDVEDTRDLTKKWREEIDQGTSPMTEWAAPPTTKTKKGGKAKVEEVMDVGSGGPLADAQAAMEKQQQQQQQQASSSSSSIDDEFSPLSTPRVEAMPEDINKGMKVDVDDLSAQQKLNKNQVVIGTAPQYKWKERAGFLELVVPVPEGVKKEDVLVHLTNRVLMVGFKTPEKKEKEQWVVGGDLFGPIELAESFWVLSKDYTDELTEGKTCIEVRLEKKEPMRRIWSTVFKDQ